ncbi:MAG TPA: CHAT domain-containing protein, partial [Saprospiraceae bacterium]|nr:CHAT domain-containing protein [Saprospiraceae bacterium]
VMRYYLLGMDEPKKSEQDIAHLCSNGASAFIAAGRYAEAESMLRKSLAFFDKDLSRWIDNRMRVMSQLAAIATLRQQPQAALACYRQAEVSGKAHIRHKSREMAKLYNDWAKYWERQQQPDSALACYQKALVQVFPDFHSLSIADNPSLDDAWAESQAMTAALGKAMLLSKLPSSTPQIAKASFESFELGLLVADRMRRTYGNDVDKMAMATQLRPAIDAAVRHLCRAYAADKSPAHLVALFHLLEQTRANALSDALRQQRALALSGMPDTLLSQEEKQRRELAFLENQHQMAEDSASKARFQNQWVKKQLAYARLLKGMGEQYPQFRQYQQADQAADIAEIAKAMPDTAALLTWHDAGDRYVCLSMHQGHLAIREVARDSAFDGQLGRFITLLNDKAAQETQPESFLALSRYLGEKLLPPDLLSAAKAFIMVPDGQLCRLPFEVLLTQPHEGFFSKAPYLLRSHTLRYVWSASLLAAPAPRQHRVSGILHCAPFVSRARDGLPVLSHSLRDMPPALHAQVRQSEAATSADFLQKAPHYAILHLSTHASVSLPEPGIEFYDRRLLRSDIYAQRLSTQLVSLSACETGSGELAQSEGVLSLARAFAYAGAKSMVASLWSVNESSTADLFSAFYEHLDRGLSRSEALRQAKLRYLEGSEMEARKLPFYWAALTLSGDDGPVDLSSPTPWLWWVLGAAAALGLAAIWWRRRQRRLAK